MTASRRTVLRAVIAFATAPAWSASRSLGAQPQARPWRIGFLTNGSIASAKYQVDAFVGGLNEQGWVEGRQFVIESRWADGRLDRLPALAAELVAQRPDLLYAPSGLAAQAVRNQGTSLPIVFAFAPDPVGQGFGRSLSRPGGNMTGLTSTHHELSAKRLELLREILPAMRRIAVLYYLAGPAAGVAEQLDETRRAASVFGIAVAAEESPHPDDFPRAIGSLVKHGPDALVVIENPMFFTNRDRLTEVLTAARIPAVFNSSEYVRSGGLLSYGASYADLSRRAASYAVKILGGSPAGHLPIERPTKFELVINALTAKAIGVTVPRALLLRADEIIS